MEPHLELSKKSKVLAVDAIEYIAAAVAARQGVWLAGLYDDLRINIRNKWYSLLIASLKVFYARIQCGIGASTLIRCVTT